MATDTERITATLRLRTGWEAIDLGFRMVRELWRPTFAAWAVTVWPLTVTLIFALREHPNVAALVIWWLKPVYDRVVLFVVSEALFGHVPTVRETLQALPGQLRSGLPSSLLWLRLSSRRSATLPVLQLERPAGSAARRERQRVLVGRASNAVLGLLVACLAFEALVLLGLSRLASLLVADYPGLDLGGESFGFDLWLLAFYVLAITLVEPFYVAGGFGIYVSRRVFLEGWDIDLAFRRLTRRWTTRAQRRGAVSSVLAVVLLVGTPALADDETRPLKCPIERPEDARACIDEILASEEFSTTREVRYWAPKSWKSDEEPEPVEALDAAWLGLLRLVAEGLRALAWVALALTLIGIVVLVLRARVPVGSPQPRDADAPTERFGLDLRPESLPDDVAAAAHARWRDGDPAGALSLLYRGALVHLVRARDIPIPDSATEAECERLARCHLDVPLAEDFSSLARAWQLCAYADEAPEEPAFERLCARWRDHLGAAA